MNAAARAPMAIGCGLAVMLAGALAHASPNEITVDVTGVSGSVGLVYGAHTQGAGIATGVDLDLYTFAGKAGDRFRIALTTLTVDLDPVVRLRDINGTVIRTVDCSAPFNAGCTLSFDETLTTAGTYTLNVSDAGSDNAGNYTLHLDRYPPVNNWLGLVYEQQKVETLGHHPDMDFYAFNGVAGTSVALKLQTLTVDVDPKLEVWGPNGSQLIDTGCSAPFNAGCSIDVELPITTTGLYRLGIFDQGWDNVGSYSLQASCAFQGVGLCPLPTDPAPFPVPEPATWALMLTGATLLAVRARRFTSRPPATT